MFEMVDAREGQTVTLQARGEIDASTAAEMRRHLEEALDGDATRVVADLTEVDFLDSAGLGVLVEAHRRLEEADRALVVRVSNPSTVRVLAITGMDRYFTVEKVEP
jgi:anti-sigma B factor antagonist